MSDPQMPSFSKTTERRPAPATAPMKGPESDGALKADAAGVLGLDEADVLALTQSGLLENGVEDLAERIWQAALPAATNAPGVRLRDAVDAAGGSPGIWATVIDALLHGRLNAFRPRGIFGAPVLETLVVSSVEVVADLKTAPSEAETPFIWTPAPSSADGRSARREKIRGKYP